MTPSQCRAAKRFAQVLGRRMAYVESGIILTGAVRDFCRTWPDQAEVTVPGIHFIQVWPGEVVVYDPRAGPDGLLAGARVYDIEPPA